MGMQWFVGNVDWAPYFPDLLRAAYMTAKYTLFGFTGGAILGLVLALMRLSRLRLLRLPARVYTELFKNTPLLTQIFIIYFGLASIGLVLEAFVAGALALMLFYAAYLSEIFRGGLQGVSAGQREAALAIGLPPQAVYGRVILPQAVRLALPATGNMLVDLLKSTSLMATIAGAELMTVARNVTAETFQALEVYLVIGAIYFALAFPLSQATLWYERQLQRGTPFSTARRRTRRHIAALSAAEANK
jgi:His/Glu/Gln/Arg/opine family amino acid ABC transporter permease subunit